MPSKTNERFLRADRKNQIETARLQQVKKLYDRSKSTTSLEIEREKKLLAKAFETVKRTSGFSDEGVAPKDENDRDFETSPNYKVALKLSEMRLLEWKTSEKQLARFLAQCEAKMEKNKKCRRHSSPEMNTNNYVTRLKQSSNATNSSSSFGMDMEFIKSSADDSVFTDDGNCMSQNERFTIDAEKLEKEITEEYKAMFKNTNVKIDRYSMKINRKAYSQSDVESIDKGRTLRFRPHTASIVSDKRRKISTQSLPVRPSTAQATQSPYAQSFIIAKDGAYINTGKTYRKINLDINQNLIEQKKTNDWVNNCPGSALPTVGEQDDQPTEIIESGLDTSEVEIDNSLQETNCGIMTMILEEETMSNNEDSSTEDNAREDHNNNEQETIKNDQSNINKRRMLLMQKGRKRSNTVSSGSDIEPLSEEISQENVSYLSRMVSARQRFGSTSTLISDQGHSLSSDIFGSTSDMSIGSDGQRRPSKWRHFINTDKVQLPQAKKLATVGAVVKAAMAFSKNARKQALEKLVEEQSADSRELIKQERLRRLESRNNVLSSIASKWRLNPEINSVQEVVEEI